MSTIPDLPTPITPDPIDLPVEPDQGPVPGVPGKPADPANPSPFTPEPRTK